MELKFATTELSVSSEHELGRRSVPSDMLMALKRHGCCAPSTRWRNSSVSMRPTSDLLDRLDARHDAREVLLDALLRSPAVHLSQAAQYAR